MSGGAEPECREAFPWGDPQAWPQDLRVFIASLAALRREQPALRSAELAVEVLQGPEGDQGLRLVRGGAGRRTAGGGAEPEPACGIGTHPSAQASSALGFPFRQLTTPALRVSPLRMGGGTCGFVTHIRCFVPDGGASEMNAKQKVQT